MTNTDGTRKVPTSFWTWRRGSTPKAISRLVNEMTSYALPEIATIFAGIDKDGPILSNGSFGTYAHLYVGQRR